MTNPIATLSRERLEQLADENTICKVSWDERIEMSRAMLAVMDANPPPVWGQARFKGGDWASCSAEHAAMVMAKPEEWGNYECRYLYTTPPAPSAPDGWKLVPIEPSIAMTEAAWDALNESHNMTDVYYALLAMAPAPGKPAW